MSRLLALLFGRLPLGWLQLTHRKGRFAGAIAGVGFADLLVFFQLGFVGALGTSVERPYQAIQAEIILSAPATRTLASGETLPLLRAQDALTVPGVTAATPLYVGQLPMTLAGQPRVSLQVFGIVPSDAAAFWGPDVAAQADRLALVDHALIDLGTRQVAPVTFIAAAAGEAPTFEAAGRTVTLAGAFTIGAGFESDGHLIVSDRTFGRLFPAMTAGAPQHVLLRTTPGVDPGAVQAALAATLPALDTEVRERDAAAAAERMFQTVERPVGMIFGFGAMMGMLVGMVIVYQVLATDVADHLREYATFKAMGYRHRFFLGVILEQALILAIAGFIPGSLVSILIYRLLAGATGLPLAMATDRLFFVFVGTLVVCVLSGAVATRRLRAADPAELFA